MMEGGADTETETVAARGSWKFVREDLDGRRSDSQVIVE